MSIIKHKKRDSPFVTIDNRVFEDDRLSWEAKGILGYLLTKPNDWHIRVKDLSNRAKTTPGTVKRCMKELMTAGYAKLIPMPAERGKFAGTYYEITECIFSPSSVKTESQKSPNLGQISPIVIKDNISNERSKLVIKEERKKEKDLSFPLLESDLTEQAIYKTIIELCCLDDTRVNGPLKYIRMFITTHREKGEIEDVFIKLKNYMACLVQTGSYTSNNPKTLILALLNTDWHKKLCQLKGDHSIKIEDVNRLEKMDATQSEYWSMVNKTKQSK